MPKLSLLFVHSPLVGPSSLRRLAAVATRAGYEVALPDLTPAASAPDTHEAYVQLAVDAASTLTAPIAAVVGHSGAGAFLPAIRAAIATSSPLVFVDAVVPPADEPHHTSDGLAALLDAQTIDGYLQPWLGWWPDEIVASLLPDAGDRVTLAADMPQLPRAFYDMDIEVPPAWSEQACAFLQLSPAYQAEAEDAKSRGWPTLELASTHLGVHTAANEVLAAVTRLVSTLEGRAEGSTED